VKTDSGYPKDVRITIYLGNPWEIQKCHSSGIGGTLPCAESGLSGEVHNETLGLSCAYYAYHIELPAKLPNYFLRSNKSNINHKHLCNCTSHTM